MSKDIRSKDQIFYLPLEKRPPTLGCRKFLCEYCDIPDGELDHHLETVRDSAWSHYPYPSIGLFVFLDLGLCGDDLPESGPTSPKDTAALQTISTAYQTILKKLKSGGRFLDVGCMFAQDTRKLIHDGAPPESCYGTDLHSEYFDYGYALFRDEKKLARNHFIAADILDTKSPNLQALSGTLNIINATHVIHVFDESDQLEFLTRLISLLKDEKGTMMTGRLTAHDRAGYHAASNASATTKSKGDIFEHNAESFQQLFARAAAETGTRWDVRAWMWKFGTHTATGDENWFRSKENGILTFIATRI